MLESIFRSFNSLYKISVAVFSALAGICDLCRMQILVSPHVLCFKLNSFSCFYDFSTRQSIYTTFVPGGIGAAEQRAFVIFSIDRAGFSVGFDWKREPAHQAVTTINRAVCVEEMLCIGAVVCSALSAHRLFVNVSGTLRASRGQKITVLCFSCTEKKVNTVYNTSLYLSCHTWCPDREPVPG